MILLLLMLSGHHFYHHSCKSRQNPEEVLFWLAILITYYIIVPMELSLQIIISSLGFMLLVISTVIGFSSELQCEVCIQFLWTVQARPQHL